MDEELVMLSALNHYMYCPRRCALIHIEQIWTENIFTAEGKIMHERVHGTGQEKRRNVRVEFGVPLRSLRLGLIGKADAVEFHKRGNMWHPFPVEYKRGKPKQDNSDKVQLCAQALCLEEMMNVEIPKGALFYGKTRRRQDVEFDRDLRIETEETSKKLHQLIASGRTVKPDYSEKCKSCSLVHLCLPKTCSRKESASRYLINTALGE
ncbi:MAG TPA: CRISPR-associated protein Cas4 [Nitrospirae bacterium]|nr:CRISPR-associated protein Cas4 [Nitrospirota bacterium]HDZ01744.1 CRISPR-associated protein Cas4 [Nitrospirota bacterium]